MYFAHPLPLRAALHPESRVSLPSACGCLLCVLAVCRCVSGAQAVAGTVRSHAPLKDVGILKRLRHCATVDLAVVPADEADPMQQLGLEADDSEPRLGMADPETPVKTHRDNRLRRSTRLSADRQIHVTVGALWPEPTWPAALAAGGVTADQHIRVWLSKPDKPRKQTKLHVHIEDLEPLLRLMHAEKKAHGVHVNSPAHGAKWAAAKEWFDCVTGSWHIKAGDEVVSRQVPRSQSDGQAVAATDYQALKDQTLLEPRQSVGVCS